MYSININKYGGLSWKIELASTTYEMLCDFVDNIIKIKYEHITKKIFVIIMDTKISLTKRISLTYIYLNQIMQK